MNQIRRFLTNTRAVLFDYDGVIADTMEDNARAWKRAFTDVGVSITDAEYYALEGLIPDAIARELGVKHGLSEEVFSKVPQKKSEYYRKNNTFRVYPEIPPIVEKLKKDGKKLALVSGAARHRIGEMTPRSLLSLFDAVIAAEDTKNSKPDPEPYRKALEKLEVSAKDSVIVENAPLGVKSAKAAGVFCIAVCTTVEKRALKDADMVIERLADLPYVFSQ